MLSYGEEAKGTHLTPSLLYKATAGKTEEPDMTESKADVNLRLKKSASFRSENKVVDTIWRFHGDISNQEKYLLDMVKVRLRLHRSKNHFV